MPLPEEAARAAAAAVASSIGKREYVPVAARFHPRFSAAYSIGKLEAAAEQELTPVGAFEEVTEVTLERADQYVRARASCRFERGDGLVVVAFDSGGSIVELFVKAHVRARGRARAGLLGLTLMGLVAGAGVLINESLNERFLFGAFVVGSMGWTLALALRGPVQIAVEVRKAARPGEVTQIASAPVAELVRFAALSTAGTSFGQAAWIGLGWSAGEMLLAISSVLGAARAGLPQARALQTLLARAGMLAFHLGATLLIARNAGFVALTALLHPAIIFATIRYAWGWTAAPVAGAVVFVGALALFGRLG